MNRANNNSMLPTLVSIPILVSLKLLSERDVLLQQRIESIRPVIAIISSFSNLSLLQDTASVSANPHFPNVELTPEERAEIELKKDLSFFKSSLQCFNFD